MKQKILDDCLAMFILGTLLFGLYLLGGGMDNGEKTADGIHHSNSLQEESEIH
jgi:hypothetical protein